MYKVNTPQGLRFTLYKPPFIVRRDKTREGVYVDPRMDHISVEKDATKTVSVSTSYSVDHKD